MKPSGRSARRSDRKIRLSWQREATRLGMRVQMEHEQAERRRARAIAH